VELKEGAVLADRFRLVRVLGKGGMGEVWAAQHIALDIPCAVKFIHADSADKADVRERFEREAKAAAALRSPNVVQILDFGVEGSLQYLAMEYLEGEALSTRIRARARLDAAETCRIIAGVSRALMKAHAAGIVHRDLKPDNIFLVPDDDGEIPKVLDFGVAKRTNQLDSNTRTGALLGTPYYMSPEQAQGIKAVDSRADLWSLAIVAFRCITGELPFKSDALGDLLIRIVTQPPPVPSHVCPGLPDSFDRWWHRVSQREPDHRYQTAKELSDALALALGVNTVTGGYASLAGVPAPNPLQKTMALDIDTPMPGQLTPYPAAGTSGAYAGHSGSYAARGAYPSNPGYGAPPMATTQPFGDSGAMGSVAGIAATPPPGPARSKGTAILVVGLLGAAAVATGAYFLTRSTVAPTAPAASTEPVEVPAPTEAPAPSASAAPPASAAASTASPAPTASASATATTKAPPRPSPSNPPRPAPSPRTPAPRPGPYDPGF
jgi:serine/threonine-protein kinase